MISCPTASHRLGLEKPGGPTTADLLVPWSIQGGFSGLSSELSETSQRCGASSQARFRARFTPRCPRLLSSTGGRQ